jgi:hypothetical protein
MAFFLTAADQSGRRSTLGFYDTAKEAIESAAELMDQGLGKYHTPAHCRDLAGRPPELLFFSPAGPILYRPSAPIAPGTKAAADIAGPSKGVRVARCPSSIYDVRKAS